jgi:hypothetical protein
LQSTLQTKGLCVVRAAEAESPRIKRSTLECRQHFGYADGVVLYWSAGAGHRLPDNDDQDF